ncbi:MAG: hypothetical protein R3264_04780, partial [Anaerolineae bacterium]|nr:hypothetical protein [Anaerolineae bacterium]
MMSQNKTPACYLRGTFGGYFLSFLALGSLACAFLGGVEAPSDRIVMLTRLPTFTPTVPPTVGATATSSEPVTITETAPLPAPTTLSPANTPAPSEVTPVPPEATTAAPAPATTSALAIPDSESAGWMFTGVQVYPGLVDDGLLLYGDVINNTGTAQELDYIAGTFYDTQGKVIADEDTTVDSWPL